MEMTQFQKDFVRMLDSMREEHKGETTCVGIGDKACEECPLTTLCVDNDICFKTEKIIETVKQWAKEHPVVTYEQKYEETFGVKPRALNGNIPCPRNMGFKIKCETIGACGKCTNEFWNSEYKPPKTGKEGYEYFQQAIKALEQKPILNKIRAEIESIIGEHKLDDYDFCSGLICARNIIDKYRESEGKV